MTDQLTLPRRFSGTVPTNNVEIVSGPYAGMTGRISICRSRIELDQPFMFDESTCMVGGVFHVGLTSGPRKVRHVSASAGRYRVLTEGEVLRREWGAEYDAALARLRE